MFTTNIHCTEFRAARYTSGSTGAVFTTVEMTDGSTSSAAVFLETRAKCDELMQAVAEAREMLPPDEQGEPEADGTEQPGSDA